LGRRSKKEDILNGRKIKAKQNLLVSAYSVHRDKRYWDNPEQFDPERFTPEKKKKYHSYQYFPFGGGPRQCIGNNFAYLEMKILLSLIYKNFEIEVLSEELELSPRLTLRPTDGIRIKLENK
jgi:cytochrome P450